MSIWGKKLGSPVPHPLVCHVLDTFALAEVLLPVLVGPRCRAALQAALNPSGSWHARRLRPAPVSMPTLAITGVTERADGPHFVRGWMHVYRKLLLLRTWAVLDGRDEIRCPEDVSEFVELVYGDNAVPCPPGWQVQWRAAVEGMRALLERRRYAAEMRYLPVPVPGRSIAGLTERSLRPLTRYPTQPPRSARTP